MRAASFALALCAVLGTGVPLCAHAAQTRVSYLAGGSVYLDAGAAEGLAVGDTVRVSRDGASVGWLRVNFLSTHRSSCDTLRTLREIRTGDVVFYETRVAAPTAAAPVAVAATSVPAPDVAPATPAPGATNIADSLVSAAAAAPSRRSAPVHGRIGARYLFVRGDVTGEFRQPALDLRLDALNRMDSRLDFSADIRSRRTTTEAQDLAESRVYRMAVSLHDPASHQRVTVGRQMSPLISAINLFDGALVEVAREHWALTAFSGAEPDPAQLQFSSAVLQHGAYLEFRNRPFDGARWSAALGGASSTDHGEPNRTFGFAQGWYRDRRLSVMAAQEIDVSTGWKRTAGEPTVSPTNTYVTANLQAGDQLSFNAGYDNRHNVRLYRDRETPETEFDDHYRQGGWVGTWARLTTLLQAGGDVRVSTGAAEDRAFAWSAAAQIRAPRPLPARLHVRYARYDAERVSNSVTSVNAGCDPMSVLHLEAGGGVSGSRDVVSDIVERSHWINGDVDVTLSRRLLLSVSGEQSTSAIERLTQGYLNLSWRF